MLIEEAKVYKRQVLPHAIDAVTSVRQLAELIHSCNAASMMQTLPVLLKKAQNCLKELEQNRSFSNNKCHNIHAMQSAAPDQTAQLLEKIEAAEHDIIGRRVVVPISTAVGKVVGLMGYRSPGRLAKVQRDLFEYGPVFGKSVKFIRRGVDQIDSIIDMLVLFINKAEALPNASLSELNNILGLAPSLAVACDQFLSSAQSSGLISGQAGQARQAGQATGPLEAGTMP